MANVLHAEDEHFVDEKPSAPPGDETDAEDFAIWEDDDVAQEQEQADEVAEEPVFAHDGPPHLPCASGSLFAWSSAVRLQRTLLVQGVIS